jgi:cephalosporin hydroxylase
MIKIDMEAGVVVVDGKDGNASYPIGSPEAFSAISRAWIRSGWDTKYVYSFSWMGRPIIQLPEDMLRVQEAIYRIKPDVVIETGIAHGGSLIYYASIFKAMGKGRVIGVDIEIRPHNRQAIEAHEMYPYITMIEGSSIAPEIVQQVAALVKPGETVMVLLDSNHTKAHVLEELKAYAPFVSKGSYIVATDGIMGDLVGAPRSSDDWGWNNPRDAALEFVASHPGYEIENPVIPFNEGSITEPVTYWPSAWIKRK